MKSTVRSRFGKGKAHWYSPDLMYSRTCKACGMVIRRETEDYAGDRYLGVPAGRGTSDFYCEPCGLKLEAQTS